MTGPRCGHALDRDVAVVLVVRSEVHGERAEVEVDQLVVGHALADLDAVADPHIGDLPHDRLALRPGTDEHELHARRHMAHRVHREALPFEPVEPAGEQDVVTEGSGGASRSRSVSLDRW